MYVKSLTLKGFKSFADPVTLDMQPGVNVVVGPNGSGKSNVIDAVAWVLGAQGASKLRGGKMDDVIFAGTGKRSALGRAEVSLTIDNSDGRVPIDFSEVTITRTLFRTGESEYQINGVPCRLLDIQELLSDSGVGRQQHVIVSQGNLGAVLNARPEDRRMIIEEAAGVLKYRKRREKSQRRLEATEGNLERLQDLVREVRQQLRPLQKQAEAAARHVGVVTELQSIRLYVAGRDIAQLNHRQDNAEAEGSQLQAQDAELRRSIAAADAAVTAVEEAMAQFSGEDLGDLVERLQGMFQRARGLQAVLTQRARGLERDLDASVSKDVVAQLEADAHNVREELRMIGEERGTVHEPFDDLALHENALANEWLSFEEEWGEGLPVASNEAAAIRGEIGALNNSLTALRRELDQRATRIAQLRATKTAAGEEQSQTAERKAELEQSLAPLRESITALEGNLSDAASVVDSADEAYRSDDQRLAKAKARAEALNEALDESRARAGVERLAEVEGIAGTLAELVAVDEGYQAAFEAAAGEAMAAVVVDSVGSARSALDYLRRGDTSGAVLVLGQASGDTHGAPEGADNVEALRSHVSGNNDAVDSLLDRILCCCVVVGGEWQDTVDFAIEYPDMIAVTNNGDRFSRGAWRLGSGGAGATSAAVEAAEAEAATCERAATEAKQRFDDARAERSRLQREFDEARKQLDSKTRLLATLDSNLERVAGRSESAEQELLNLHENVKELNERIESDASRLDELQQRLPDLEAAEATGEERARMWRHARSVLEERSAELRAQRSELEVRVNSLEERATYLANRLTGLDARIQQHRRDVEEAAQRRAGIQRSIKVVARLQNLVESHAQVIGEQLQEVRERRNVERDRRREVSDHLEAQRKRRSQLERDLLSNNERKQQHDLRQAEVRLRLEAVLETLERDLGVGPEVAMEAPEPELPQGQTAKQRMAELDRELRQMGPINPLALEEYETVKERHEFLDKQLQDVQESRRELVRVIRAVDTEIVETFKSAYEDVARNFEQLFGMLFPGGAGSLRLTDPDNPLETGIEIEAKPSGKNVRTLSLLSGGERSLAAMAFLFAVFRSRPSPFYLLDEVEAALDDMNLSRFLMLIDEFRSEAQLVVVSHQKRTMEKADCLYGVSMQSGGSSKVVSERVHVDVTDSTTDAVAATAS